MQHPTGAGDTRSDWQAEGGKEASLNDVGTQMKRQVGSRGLGGR
jgi:hypothetical protein